MNRINFLKSKLKAARVEEHQWTKTHVRATKALNKIKDDITQLEKKIELELAKSQ